MIDLTLFYKKGQKVKFYDSGFDTIEKICDCIVKSVSKDSMIITDLKTNTDLHIEEGFNLENVFAVANESVEDMSSGDLWTRLSEDQKTELYQMHLGDIISDDVESLLNAKQYEKYELTEDDIEDIVSEVMNNFVYNNRVNLDDSYWDNLNFLIYEALDN